MSISFNFIWLAQILMCHPNSFVAKTVRKDPEQNKFLYEILPEKVLVRDYLASLNSQDHDPSSKSTH